MTADVVVVGAGPAGSIAAARLAAAGIDTVLVDHRRPVVTELQTLTLDAYRLLVDLAGREILADAVQVAESMCVRWRPSDAAAPPVRVEQLLVDRSSLDSSLRAFAVRAGARLVLGRVSAIEGSNNARSHRIVTSVNGLDIVSRSVIVAAGRTGTLGARRRKLAPRTIALLARFETSNEALPAHLCIEALRDGWIWATRHDRGAFIVAVTSPVAHRELTERLRTMTGQASLLKELTGCAFDISAIVDATPSVSARTPVPGVHEIGDAALFLDPLSGHGLSAAIRSAVQTTDSLVRAGIDIDAVTVVRETTALAAHHQSIAKVFYIDGATRFSTPFWCDRATTTPSTSS